MKKIYLIAGSITLAISSLVFILWLFQPDLSFLDSTSNSRLYVDVTKDITLDMKNSSVSLNEWGRNYVEIRYDNGFGKKVELDVTNNGNVIILNSVLDFSGYKHLDVKVPKTAIIISANIVDAKSGTFRAVKADKGMFKYCSMTDGFVSEGRELEIRESSFKGSSIMKNEVVNIRECEGENIVLSSDNSGKKLTAFLRELTGNSVKLDTKSCNNLDVELKDSVLNKLAVDYSGKDGKITIFSAKIKEIENNSNIDIKYKKSVIN